MTDEPTSASTDQRSRGRYASALRSRDLRTLMVSYFVDGSASWAYSIVLIAYVFERTHFASTSIPLQDRHFVYPGDVSGHNT